MKEEKVFIENSSKEKLAAIIHNANDDKDFIVIVCHGYPGNKDEGMIKGLAKYLENNNINAIRFDFSGNGKSQGLFEDATYSKEIEDLKFIIDYLKNKNYKKIVLIGHSMGGSIVILETAKYQNADLIVSMAEMVYPEKFKEKVYEHQKKAIEKAEVFYWNEPKYGKQFPITPEFIKDVESYHPIEDVKKIKCPIMFVHGKKDTSISYHDSEDIYKEANEPKVLELLKNSGHLFRNETEKYKMFKKIIEFIKEHK